MTASYDIYCLLHSKRIIHTKKVTFKVTCDALRNLIWHQLQFKEHDKHPWRSVTFSKVAGNFTKSKITLLHECFSRF